MKICHVAAALAASACVMLSSCASPPASAGVESAPIVHAPAGAVQGRTEGALNVFKGIPYALPPVGAARWSAPQAMPDWEGVREAHDFGPVCMQNARAGESVYSQEIGAMSEDCLTLNIWAPKDAQNAPVLVWIHGGALVAGASSEMLYDGARLAEEGVVVVSINYRLGVLGFLAHAELSAESPRGVSGNYGLLDQIEALRWVERNIGAFGGDAGNVTIAGESAGALSVMYLMIAPDARGLFAKAISQSGYMISTPALKQSVQGEYSAEAVGAYIGAQLNAPDIAALRALDASALVSGAAAARYVTTATIDGVVLPGQMVDVFKSGQQAPVPMIAGFNSGEIRTLTVLAPPVPATAAEYESAIRERYRDLADDFLALYPSSDMQESIYATTRDGLYGWSAVEMAMGQTAIGAPGYLYLWDHGYPAMEQAGLHAFHASELPYMFGNLSRTPPNWPPVPDSAEERALADMMVDYWTSFARSGIPAAAQAPAWPAYGTDGAGAYLHFAEAPRAASDLMPGMYELLDEVVCRRRQSGDQPWHWNHGLAAPVLPDPSPNCD
jgi:para-nitrobenzyl esterase